MNLRDFITETLVDLVEGVVQAQYDVASRGAGISPQARRGIAATGQVLVDESERFVTLVHFEVGLTSGSEKDASGGLKVLFAQIGGQLDKRSSQNESSVTRIAFDVPVALPNQSHTEKRDPQGLSLGVVNTPIEPTPRRSKKGA